MSKDKAKKPNVDGSDFYIAIVASRYNNDLVEKLLDAARATLRKARVAENSIKVLRVPGAAEIPYVANMLALTDEYDCIIALGVIIKGDTNHDEVIAQTTARSLQEIGIDTEIPVINGILSTNTREQAAERAGGKINRGVEFAEAALEMAWHKVQLIAYLDHLAEEQENETADGEDEELRSGEYGFDDLGDDDEDDDDDEDSPYRGN
ncbi:MAG: 6,7-dimethyl-8-ribityllumazine synthase [Puniceicoccales bacterium]|jgi:6,7-dimethyl-8-ribityllumazine synthase|nr:6,7-dimethyl-8-ribityllumazine synthase [Puniceicoccales bacterium]